MRDPHALLDAAIDRLAVLVLDALDHDALDVGTIGQAFDTAVRKLATRPIMDVLL